MERVFPECEVTKHVNERGKKRTARISKQRFHFHCSAKYHSSKNPHVIKTGLFRFHLLQAIYKLQLNRAEIILHSEGTAVRAG